MTKPLRVEAEAEAELWGAADWSEAERPGLGDDFLKAVLEKLDQVQEQPEAASLALEAPAAAAIRQAQVRRFPYRIVYVDLPEELWVIAFAHARRDPGYWKDRLSS